LTATEKLLGKRQFDELLSDKITKSPGKPTLAPATDNREAITVKASAAEDFTNCSDAQASNNKN
ncbi:MAG: DUF2800 domain-containing protein, partial [Acetanaerobacterium sp.]